MTNKLALSVTFVYISSVIGIFTKTKDAKMKTEVKTITPEIASAMLSGNYDNRRLRKKTVEFYADEMIKGNWQVTHQGIAISLKGRLLDGQHRLSAVVKSGVSVDMVVFSDCEDSTFHMLDVGANRTASDTVGVKRKSAGVIARIVAYSRGSSTSTSKISHSLIKDIYEKHSDIFKILEANSGVKGLTSGVLAGVFIYILNGGDSVKLNKIRQFLRYGTIEGISQAMVYAGVRFMRNEDRFNSKAEAGAMMYKAMRGDGSAKIVRVTKKDVELFMKECKNVVDMATKEK